MEQRVANLEQVTADMRVTLAQINERTASIEKHGATKSDLANLKVWFVLTAIALSGTAFAAARFIS